jgi:membrane protein DedA with SNARE-associated domain
MSEIIGDTVGFITNTISGAGYAGLFGLMIIDSLNVPLPSEIILAFSGYLVTTGAFNFWLATLFASLGSTIGSIISYWIGYKGGRRFVMRFGKYFLISGRDLERADRLFSKYGNAISFFSRMIPLLRTFISLPAGVTRMPFKRFVLYTFAGSLPWSALVIYLGKKVGENYEVIQERFEGVEYVVFAGVGLAFIAWVVHFIWEQRAIRREQAEFFKKERGSQKRP